MSSSRYEAMDSGKRRGDRYGSTEEPEAETNGATSNEESPYLLQKQDEENDGLMRVESNESNDSDDDDEEEDIEMSIEELLYSSSSYYAIAKPVTLTMILAALSVVFINSDELRAAGAAAMASAYQVWTVGDSSETTGQNLAFSFANALIMVCVICAMTFAIVLLYRFKFMKCLIGYMILCSGTLLGVLGGNLFQTAIHIYGIPVTKFSFLFVIFNFCIVGVLSVFWGQGIPKFVTQGYLIATSVILAWHLSFFDSWTAWTLLIMVALYDLCAVLTPCGPLRALVNLMSEDDSPEMPGLLFEAELPPEAKRPGVPRSASKISQASAARQEDVANPASPTTDATVVFKPGSDEANSGSVDDRSKPEEGPLVDIPLAIARVYNLQVIAIPTKSLRTMYPQRYRNSSVSSSPLLRQDQVSDVSLPENPTALQLRALVTVRLPLLGGRIEHVSRRGKKVYLERDRHGHPKRILWVDRNGKVFAEMRGDDEDGPERNSIRLGLGDFIFYSLMVAKAAQYSFATFAACILAILAGLGGTLVLLSVYHHALPALPISIFLGVIAYLVTRAFILPWIEFVLGKPYYV